MSPEQVRGELVDNRTDVWGFGCVLFELLSGRQPFSGSSIPDLIASVLKTDPDWSALPQDTPSRVRTFMQRCLQKETSQRLQDITLALAEIQPGTARPEESPRRDVSAGKTIRSLAVLPFVNAGGNPDMTLVRQTCIVLHLLLQLDDCIENCFRSWGTSRNVNVDRYDFVDSLHDVICAIEAATRRAGAHRDDPLRLRHLVVNLLQHRPHLVVNSAENHQHIGLFRRKAHDFRAETREVIMRRDRRHEFNRTAGRSEGIRPKGTLSSPIDKRSVGSGEETLVLSLGLDFGNTHKSRL